MKVLLFGVKKQQLEFLVFLLLQAKEICFGIHVRENVKLIESKIFYKWRLFEHCL